MLYPNNGKRKDAKQNTDAPYKGYSVSTELKPRIRTIVPMSEDNRGVQPSNNTGVKDTKNPEGEDPVVFVTYSPVDMPTDTSLVNHVPPDRTGEDMEKGLVIHASNAYVVVSTDQGGSSLYRYN